MEEGQTRPGCRSGENGAEEEDAGRGGMTEEDEEEEQETQRELVML